MYKVLVSISSTTGGRGEEEERKGGREKKEERGDRTRGKKKKADLEKRFMLIEAWKCLVKQLWRLDCGSVVGHWLTAGRP